MNPSHNDVASCRKRILFSGALWTLAWALAGCQSGGKVSMELRGEHLLMGRDLSLPDLIYTVGKGELPRTEIKEEFRRAGFFHPIRTPSGVLISDNYATNHVHQHGIWFAWTKTGFQGRQPDFWNVGDKKGTVVFEKLEKKWSRGDKVGFAASLRYVDLTSGRPVQALAEKWEVTEHGYKTGAHYSLMDLKVTDEALSSPLLLPKYHYGGLGFRGRESWNGAGNWKVLTSEGVTDRVKANETKARWCYVGGLVEGRQAGVVIMCSPRNFRSPQPIRVHPTEPFFCYAPSQGGDWSIEPGKPYVSEYRFVFMDGAPDPDEIEHLYLVYEQLRRE